MTEHIVYINDIESIVLAKYFIETKLIEKKEITEKMNLNDFIRNFININQNILIFDIMTRPIVTSFCIYELDDDIYIFFVEQNERCNRIIKFLKDNNYKIPPLNRYSGTNNLLRIGINEYDIDI